MNKATILLAMSIGFLIGYLCAGQIIDHDVKDCHKKYYQARQLYAEVADKLFICQLNEQTEDWYNVSYRLGDVGIDNRED